MPDVSKVRIIDEVKILSRLATEMCCKCIERRVVPDVLGVVEISKVTSIVI